MQNFTKVNNYEASQHSAALNVLIEAQSRPSIGFRKKVGSGVEWIRKKVHEPNLVEASLNKDTVAQANDRAELRKRAEIKKAEIKKENKIEAAKAESKMKDEAVARALAFDEAEKRKYCNDKNLIVKTPPYVAKMTAEEIEGGLEFEEEMVKVRVVEPEKKILELANLEAKYKAQLDILQIKEKLALHDPKAKSTEDMLKRAHAHDLITAKIRAIQDEKLAIQDENLAIEKQTTAPIFPSAPELSPPPNYTEIGNYAILERAKAPELSGHTPYELPPPAYDELPPPAYGELPPAYTRYDGLPPSAPELPAYTELCKPGYGNREVERMLEVCRKMSNLGIIDIRMSLEWQKDVKVLTNNLVKAKKKLPSNEIIQKYYQQLKKKLKEFEIESHKLSNYSERFNTTKWATYWNDFIESKGLDLTDIREIQ